MNNNNVPEVAEDPATNLNVILLQAAEKVAFCERMLPFGRALEHHMHRLYGEDGVSTLMTK